MITKAGDIYFIDDPRLGKSEHGHPCLVTGFNSELVFICFISSKLELKTFDDLIIEKVERGFETTGLTCDSINIANPITDVPKKKFSKAKYKGYISGDLKQRIERWWGSPLN